ncbi:peptidase C13 family-domain-containing protein [Pelagophyceae sp. CCMP2097]|nr:peptidase C13 family-domain-containing protein [Pelagophyceae sp. CCMP2097]
MPSSNSEDGEEGATLRLKLAILLTMGLATFAAIHGDELWGRPRAENVPPLGPHEDTWVVAIGASRYWANYRHGSNALAIRRAASTVPADRVLLMLAEVAACDARNSKRGAIYLSTNNAKAGAAKNLVFERPTPGAPDDACEYTDVDYSGVEVMPQSVVDLLVGRHSASEPRSRRLESNANSNVLLYMTGHGGDEFLKFHDSDELAAQSIAAAVREMYAKKRYRKLTIIIDTCQAASLFKYLDAQTTPHVLTIASALTGQNAYASAADADIGIALADRFTEQSLKFLDRVTDAGHVPRATFGAFADYLGTAPTHSTLHVSDTAQRAAAPNEWRSTPLADFFASPPVLRFTPFETTREAYD